MQDKNYRKLKDFLLGFLLAAAIAVPTLVSRGYFKPIPYSNVEMIDLSFTEEGHINFVANFYKNDVCKFNHISVNGFDLGVWTRLLWYDPEGELGDRTKGNQTLHMVINDLRPASHYEIAVRHYCLDSEGKYTIKVDTIFYEWDYEQIEQYEDLE